jgi:hypothetical protein
MYIYTGVVAQQNMTLYQMHDISQSNSLNPSVASDCKWSIMSNISVAAGIPVSYNDLGAGKDYIDGTKFLSLLKNTNLISSNINLNLMTIGYRTGNLYLQASMSEKVAAKVSFSNELFELLLKGNAPYAGKTINANLALSMSVYREYALNVAYDFGNDLWFGARGKLLFGRIGAQSINNILSLDTDPATYALELKSDILLNASIPGSVAVDPSDNTVNKFNSRIGVKHFIANPANNGAAIDLGVNKSFENGWKLSASVLNIGVINWTKDTHQLYQKSALKYSGPTPEIKQWSDFADTLKSVRDFRYAGGASFLQWLAPEVIAGISYPVMDYLRAGITGYAGVSSVGVPWAITATALTDNTSHVFGAVSYTVANSSFVNIGAGLGLRMGGFNIHAITDNLLAFFNPASQRYATLQIGINFKFGCGEGGGKSKEYKSVPCPSFGHSMSGKMTSIPCSSGK